MSIILENTIHEIPPGETSIIDVYYTISGLERPYITFYLKLNTRNKYDSFVKKEDFNRIYRAPKITLMGTILYENVYYRILNVNIKETIYKAHHTIVSVTSYEIIELGKCGYVSIHPDFINFITNNRCVYTVYDDDDCLVTPPWVLYKTIHKKYREFIEIYGFMREFDKNMPYFKLKYNPPKEKQIDSICIRIIVFMDKITLNCETVSGYDIRYNDVFVGDQENCEFFGIIV